MLAPSYRRQPTKRERGISLSRTSSQQKFYSSTNQQLNQSFQCHEPQSQFCYNDNHIGESVLKQRNQNRLSVMPQKYTTHRLQQQKPHPTNHSRKRSTLHTTAKQPLTSDPSFHLDNSLFHQTESIHQMIDLLTEYEKSCQQQMDLESAEEARKRINQLKIESINTRRKELEVEGKQYVIKTRRSGQLEKRQFYEFWDHKLLEARQALKEIQQKHLQEQRKQLLQFEHCLHSQPPPAIKFSSAVLDTRRNLTSLIKSRKYKEAEHLKELLAKRQAEEQDRWAVTCQEKKALKIREFRKKQQVELEAFRLKLNSSFNQLLKEKEKQEERMVKKMKKMQVQARKMPSALVKAKQELLNQSKANIENEEY